MNSNTVPFGEYSMRILWGEDHSIAWINLHDLLQILERPEVIGREQTMKLCPSRTQLPFRKRGREQWAISPYDVYKLLRPIRKENTRSAELCSRVEAWLNELLEKAAVKASSAAVITREPVIFNYQDKIPVSFIAANGKLMINITPMSKGFGVVPTIMLHRPEIMRYRQELVDKGISENLESQVFTVRGRNHGATWVEQSLAIEYARILSPEFSVWCNNCVSEVMTKGLVTMDGVSGVQVPAVLNMDEARQLIVQQQEQIQTQQSQISEVHHKVEFYDNIIENRDFFTTTFIANELDTTAYQLHTFLRESNICRRGKYQWEVLSPFRCWQCDAPYYRTNKWGKRLAALRQKRWTKFGREQILELWRGQPPKVKLLPPATRSSLQGVESGDHYKTTDLADELKITPYRLHHFLADHNICCLKGAQWVVFTDYAAWQCDVPCYRTCRITKSGESTPVNKRKRWTEQGRENILELWLRCNPQDR